MSRPARIDLDADDVGKGFAQLVLAVMEIVRELLERQAVRRLEAGDLDDDQIERLGRALQDIARQLDDLRAVFTPQTTRSPRPTEPTDRSPAGGDT